MKCKSYVINLLGNNNRNDLYYIIGSIGIDELGILRSYIYTNVKKSRQNLYLKLITTIYSFSNKHTTTNQNNDILKKGSMSGDSL